MPDSRWAAHITKRHFLLHIALSTLFMAHALPPYARAHPPYDAYTDSDAALSNTLPKRMGFFIGWHVHRVARTTHRLLRQAPVITSTLVCAYLLGTTTGLGCGAHPTQPSHQASGSLCGNMQLSEQGARYVYDLIFSYILTCKTRSLAPLMRAMPAICKAAKAM